jgi:hypothetical protein
MESALGVEDRAARPAPEGAPILGRHASPSGRLDPRPRGCRPRQLRDREPPRNLRRGRDDDRAHGIREVPRAERPACRGQVVTMTLDPRWTASSIPASPPVTAPRHVGRPGHDRVHGRSQRPVRSAPPRRRPNRVSLGSSPSMTLSAGASRSPPSRHRAGDRDPRPPGLMRSTAHSSFRSHWLYLLAAVAVAPRSSSRV